MSNNESTGAFPGQTETQASPFTGGGTMEPGVEPGRVVGQNAGIVGDSDAMTAGDTGSNAADDNAIRAISAAHGTDGTLVTEDLDHRVEEDSHRRSSP